MASARANGTGPSLSASGAICLQCILTKTERNSMSEENKDTKTVRDLKPEKDPKGGAGVEPPESKKGLHEIKEASGGPSPVPPIAGIN